ncbi:MAG: exodeoxyribonuclease III [Gammaproteobacteria bacterium]|nr:exodeoxyribonuclease III [Gammaproteobacteria bacterium]
MKIATWNVNSLRVRLEQVLAWLATHRPDVLVLQETKLVDEKFPADEFGSRGYQVAFNGQKTYNGVATISRFPIDAVETSIPKFDDPQRRVLAATINGVRIANVYVPNGSEVGSQKFAYKLDWLRALTAWVQEEVRQHQRYAILGDFNIAPEDRDVHDPDKWRGSVLCSEAERAAFGALLDCGLHDCFRKFEQPEKSFSWWDYRAGSYRRNAGLRIDHILVTQPLQQACSAASIDREPRGNQQPSDHAPVLAEFSD